MVIDPGEAQVLERTLAEGVEQFALGFAGVDLAGRDLVEQRFQLATHSLVQRRERAVLLPDPAGR